MRQKRQYDKRVIKGPVVLADQFCMVYSKSIPKYMVSKLHPKWRGPYKCVQVWDDGRMYRIQTPRGEKVYNFELIKPLLCATDRDLGASKDRRDAEMGRG